MSVSPGWGKGRPAGGVYWTKRRVATAMRSYMSETTGALPVDCHDWSEIKKTRMDLPTAGRILELWRSMARAWLAVGAESHRVPRLNTRWSKSDLSFLLENAGEMPLEDIAKRLRRSYAAVRTKLGAKGFGLKARENQGFLTGCRVALEYGVSVYEVQKRIKAGSLKATFNAGGHRWRIDPVDADRAFAGTPS